MGYERFAVADVALHLVHRDLRLRLLFDAAATHVNTHHMSSNSLISTFLMLVTDDEYHVETRQDGSLKVDVFTWGFEIVVATKYGIRSCQD